MDEVADAASAPGRRTNREHKVSFEFSEDRLVLTVNGSGAFHRPPVQLFVEVGRKKHIVVVAVAVRQGQHGVAVWNCASFNSNLVRELKRCEVVASTDSLEGFVDEHLFGAAVRKRDGDFAHGANDAVRGGRGACLMRLRRIRSWSMTAAQPERFRGLIPLRIAFAAMGLFVFGAAISLPFTAPGGVSTASEVAAMAVFLLLTGGAAFGSVAIAVEEVVVEEEGIVRHNVIWPDRTLPWDQVVSVSLDTDFNTHPAVKTRAGKTIRLRGAASLWASERSAAKRAFVAIERQLAERR